MITESTSPLSLGGWTNNKDYYEFKLRKDVVDKGLNTVAEVGKSAFGPLREKVLPHLGAGAAAGTASATAIKLTSGMPIVPRMLAVGGTAITVAAGTTVGLALGQEIVKNKIIKSEEISNSSPPPLVPTP